jgi:ribonuclease Z
VRTAYIAFPLFILVSLSGAPASSQTIQVTFLGTGTPGLSIERTGPATLVQAGDLQLLFDVGRAASIRLSQVGVTPSDVDAVFITHFHSDHIGGLSDLWLTGYMAPVFRQDPLPVVGPTGLRRLTDGLEAAFAVDREQRQREYELLGLPMTEEGASFVPREFDDEGVVFAQGGVEVTAFSVTHGEGPAFGYRVDYGGRSVVISGDTSPSENLISHAAGADVVIHEVFAVDDESLKLPVWQGIESLHTTPTDAAVVFSRIGPKLAVYHHIGLIGVPLADVIELTTTGYSGELLVAEDLMSIEIGDIVRVLPSR